MPDTAQSAHEQALEKGYFGDTPDDPHGDDAYAITTGPDAPPLQTDDRTRFNPGQAGATAPTTSTDGAGDDGGEHADAHTITDGNGDNGDNGGQP